MIKYQGFVNIIQEEFAQDFTDVLEEHREYARTVDYKVQTDERFLREHKQDIIEKVFRPIIPYKQISGTGQDKHYGTLYPTLREALFKDLFTIFERDKNVNEEVEALVDKFKDGTYREIAGENLKDEDRLVYFNQPGLTGYFDVSNVGQTFRTQTYAEAALLAKKLYNKTPCG